MRESNPAASARKSTQRERILKGMVDAVVREGYAAATIAQVIEQAGVSRPTFYEYFSDKDDCFLAAVASVQQQLLDRTRRAVESVQPSQAATASVEALIEFAASEPERAHFLTNQLLAGGPRALDARDRGTLEIATLLEEAQACASGYLPDIAPRVLIGGIQRLLATRLRHGQQGMEGVLEDLLAWVESYERPSDERRWSDLEALATVPPWPVPPEMILRAPAPLTMPRSRPYQEVAENQRQRIMFATAAVAEEVGYSASTVAQITRRAGISHRSFARLFVDKQAAFMATHELGFQRTLAFAASAFFACENWPESIWESGRAYAQFLHLNPEIAHIGLVEAYAVGPDAVRRVEDSLRGFTIFLQEGQRHTSQTTQCTSPLALEAIAASIFELCYLEIRRDRGRRLAHMVPHNVFLCLAPFLGTAEANRLIDAKLAGTADA